ncbi:MAG: SDR family oxidoreductase, partial [Bacteroidota bacterium]
IAQGGGGSLLFLSSVTGHQAAKTLGVYGMTKGALEVLAKQLVVELSAHKIRVNAVAPGATITERTMEDADYEEVWSKLTPLGRPAYPSDVAETALFLVSEKARHITGQTIIVDGGWTVTSPYPA